MRSLKMKKFLLPLCVYFSVCLFAQDSSSPESNASPLITSQAPNSSENSQPIGSRQEKSPKKEKNKKSQEGDDLNASIFSESVATAVTRRLRDALEGHNQRLMLSAFDSDKMPDYSGFEGQIEAFFNQYASFRVHLRILQTTAEAEKRIVLTDIELEALPGGDAVPVRKHDQIRLELKRSSKGWRIVDVKPRDFFS